MLPERDDRYYRSEEETLFAIAEALHEEYRAIIDAGFILQVDDAYLASWYDMMLPNGTLADYRKWVGVRIAALNQALKGLPEQRTRVHICWGSWSEPRIHQIVPLRSDHRSDPHHQNRRSTSLEAANVRHEHEWHVWENVKLPEGKVPLPGIVGHVSNVIEHPRLVAFAWSAWPAWSAART